MHIHSAISTSDSIQMDKKKRIESIGRLTADVVVERGQIELRKRIITDGNIPESSIATHMLLQRHNI